MYLFLISKAVSVHNACKVTIFLLFEEQVFEGTATWHCRKNSFLLEWKSLAKCRSTEIYKDPADVPAEVHIFFVKKCPASFPTSESRNSMNLIFQNI